MSLLIRTVKKPQGRTKNTWMGNVMKELKSINIANAEQARQAAEDTWQKIIQILRSATGMHTAERAIIIIIICAIPTL